MSTGRCWQARVGDDSGSISVFLAASAVGLLLLIGLIADGGVKARAVAEADALAAEAARAGGQALDLPAAVGGDIHVSPTAAVTAAQTFLTDAGVPGTVTVAPDATTLQVTVTLTRPTVVVALIGITHVTATGAATVTLVHAVTGDTP